MSQRISKEILNQSIELISELNLNEEDYKRILDKLSMILKKKFMKRKYNSLMEEILKEGNCNDETEMRDLMKEIVKIIPIDDLNEVLTEVVKNEGLIDFIQDLFLEKLI